MLEAKNVVKTFDGFRALDGVSMTVPQGAVYGLVGPNGAGKSTIIRHFTGIYRPDSGEITLDGQPIYENPAVKGRMAAIPDDWYFFPQASIREMARLYAGTHPFFSWDRYHKLREVFPLSEKQPLRRMSKGMQKQAAFWLTMSCMPEVLVLDEPTAGLDPAGRENLMANIRDYHRNKGKTIILVSHSMDEIARNVDRILVLKNAHVLMQGTPAEVFARGEELLSAGLDVPQITRIAMELKRRGVDIDPAVYTVEALERQLLALRKGGAGC